MIILDMAKKYYPKLWNKKRILALLEAGRITKEDFEVITGEKV